MRHASGWFRRIRVIASRREIAPRARPNLAALGSVLFALALLGGACASEEVASAPDDGREPITRTTTSTTRNVHVVQPGENLAAIAAAHDVALSTLIELNGIEDPARIEIGQEIVFEVEVVELVDIFPAGPLRLTSPAADRSGVLNEFEWPVEMSIGESATAFVVVAGVVTALALLVAHSAASLAFEAAGSRVPGLPGLPNLPRLSRPAGNGEGTASEPKAALRFRIGQSSARGVRSLLARSAAALATGRSSARRGGLVAGRTLHRWTPRGVRGLQALGRAGWRLLAVAMRSLVAAMRLLAAAMRLLTPLRKRAAASARSAASERRLNKVRSEVEARAEVTLRIGLLEEAEAQFRASLAECEAEGWPIEAGLCLRGLAEVAERRGNLPRRWSWRRGRPSSSKSREPRTRR